MAGDVFLIVDDNDELRHEVVSYLNRYGVPTIDVSNAQKAREVLLSQPVAIVILDVIMPGETGLDLTKWISQNLDTPVILLTSLDDVTDRVAGLELGADDYISKPFDPRELLARARSVLRRQNMRLEQAANESEKNTFMLCLRTGRLSLPCGRVETLKNQELRVLHFLAEHAGEVVTREMLYSHVYGRHWNPADRAIDNIVVRLRRIMDAADNHSSVISTVRNQGYQIEQNAIAYTTMDPARKRA